MLGKQMIYNEHDFEAIKTLKNFLPDKIFDAHAHLFNTDFTPSLLQSAKASSQIKVRDDGSDKERSFLHELKADVPMEIKDPGSVTEVSESNP